MYNTQLKLEEKKKKRIGPKAVGQHQKLSAHRSSGLRASWRLVVLPASGSRLRESAPNLQPFISHKEQPAMYFPVANLFLTSDMR